MTGKLGAALEAAARGQRVFPLIPNAKTPAISSYSLRASMDTHVLTSWWTENPEYNIGIATGDGLTVADIDVKKGKPGLESYQELDGHYETFVVKTPTNGYHCYFKGPDCRLAVDLLPGIDIRSKGGYVVGPGSTIDGVPYEIVADKPLAEVPFGIAIRLESPHRRSRVASHVELDTPTAIANARIWATNAEPAVEGLGGDNVTYKTAVRLVRDFALSEEVAYEILAEVWNVRCSPPWEPEELWRKIQNAHEYGVGDLGAARPEQMFGPVTVIAPPPPEPKPTPQELGLTKGNALDPAAVTARPWLVPKLLMLEGVTLINAIGSGGKSSLSLTIAAHFAVGKDFGPYKLTIPYRPVVSIIHNDEDDAQEQARRLLAICACYKLDYQAVKSNLVLVCRGQTDFRFARANIQGVQVDQETVDFWADLAHREGAQFIALDPLINIHECAENDNMQMSRVMKAISAMAEKSGAAVMVMHHTGKGSSSSSLAGSTEAARGASAIGTAIRIAITMTNADSRDCEEYGIDPKDRFKYVRLDDAKANVFLRSNQASLWLKWETVRLHSGDDVGVPVIHDMSTTEKEARADLGLLIRDMIVARQSGFMTLTQVAEELKAVDDLYGKMDVKNVKAQIRKLMRKGAVQVDDDTVQLVSGKYEGKDNILLRLM